MPGHAVLAGSEKKTWKMAGSLTTSWTSLSAITAGDPSRVGFTRPRGTKEPWLLYNTPKEITERIAEIHISHYKWNHGFYKGSGHPDPSDVKVQKIAFTRARGVPSATDYLYCFEGGTGGIENKTGQKRYSYWSLMGFVSHVSWRLTNWRPGGAHKGHREHQTLTTFTSRFAAAAVAIPDQTGTGG